MKRFQRRGEARWGEAGWGGVRLCPALHVGRGHLREQELAEELAHAVLHAEDGLGMVRLRLRLRPAGQVITWSGGRLVRRAGGRVLPGWPECAGR